MVKLEWHVRRVASVSRFVVQRRHAESVWLWWIGQGQRPPVRFQGAAIPGVASIVGDPEVRRHLYCKAGDFVLHLCAGWDVHLESPGCWDEFLTLQAAAAANECHMDSLEALLQACNAAALERMRAEQQEQELGVPMLASLVVQSADYTLPEVRIKQHFGTVVVRPNNGEWRGELDVACHGRPDHAHSASVREAHGSLVLDVAVPRGHWRWCQRHGHDARIGDQYVQPK